MRRDGRCIREMARVLSRSPSSISRELRRNRSPVYDFYIDHLAQERADRRRSNASRTLTLDNGPENAEHEAISKATDIKCFFYDIYSAWQRGTNEHTNGLVRQCLPKKTDLATEGRRMRSKCFGFKTPLEVANLNVALQR